MKGTLRKRRCPNCSESLVRRAPQQNLGERLLGFFTIYPIRCQFCAHRYLAFLGVPKPLPQRDFNRVNVNFPVWFRPVGFKPPMPEREASLSNLSIGGCRINTTLKLPKGTRLRLEIEISEDKAPIAVKEAVVRSQIRGGLGVTFKTVRDEELRRIGRILYRRHLSSHRKRLSSFNLPPA